MTGTPTEVSTLTNPVINAPYDPPEQHFELGPDGTPTGTLIAGRRPSESFIPVPLSKKGGSKGQVGLDFDLAGERRENNSLINDIRREVGLWRARNYPGATAISRKLMLHWANPERENRVLFCQREAAETAIFLAEAAGRHGIADYRTRLVPENHEHNSGLPRVALKMATGAGKTVVMAMLVAWQTLNKVHTPQDARFTKRFLVVTPGITIRDRLRVLLPSDPGNYYKERDLVPGDLWGGLQEAQLVIANYHQFLKRDRKEIQGVASNTRKILTHGKKVDPFQETDDEMVARVLRDFMGRGSKGAAGEIVVFNDEAHHCYQNKPLGDDDEKLEKEAEERNRDARVWFRGLQAVKRKIGIKNIYDLSATPFYLSGSGHQEGYIFPWVVSDFSLMDAIESGIVKVPRLPVDDDARAEALVYRNLWSQIGTKLPKKRGRKLHADITQWDIPATLEGALRSLYRSYEKAYLHWHEHLRGGGYETPPVFIVVCPNTVVSKLVFDWISGFDVEQPDGTTRARPGNLDLLSNVAGGEWIAKPRTVLIDSAQLESGESMKDDFKAAVTHEIDTFKAELRSRHSSVDVDNLSDEDLLREVMNTVGKPGRLGEGVRCVVSVSMLTEGWDANTVTHILGIRAFNSRLLCEQVVGRALRRRNYTVNDDGHFEPEYAEVYGVPFDFIPSDKVVPNPTPRPAAVHVRALPERGDLRITYPRLVGYRLELIDEPLFAAFDEQSRLVLEPADLATWTQMQGQAGEAGEHYLEDTQNARAQKVSYVLAAEMMKRLFVGHDGAPKHWYFPQVAAICKQWLTDYLVVPKPTDIGLLMLSQYRQRAIDKIEQSIRQQVGNQRELLRPRFDVHFPESSTDTVDFPTRKVVIEAIKSPVNFVVLDGPKGNTWEEALAYYLEHDARVASFVKNDHLEFMIPYVFEGVAHEFWPDFLVRLHPLADDSVMRTLIVEVSGGRKDRDKREVKAHTARDSWCVAVNNHGGYGRWGFVEVSDMATFQKVMDRAIDDLCADGVVTGGVDL
jgi:type III restriction enzyme